jgi:hypothetical protein
MARRGWGQRGPMGALPLQLRRAAVAPSIRSRTAQGSQPNGARERLSTPSELSGAGASAGSRMRSLPACRRANLGLRAKPAPEEPERERSGREQGPEHEQRRIELALLRQGDRGTFEV